MKASELRASLLQEAVSGRLVPQMDGEGSAADLLQEIAAERAALVAAGKLKKEKPLPAISEEEIPFEIPESWGWVRLGEIGVWQAGGTPSRAHPEYYYNGTVPWVKSGDLNDGEISNTDESITFEGVENSSAKINPVGSVVLAMYGATIGKTGILMIDAATNQACCACKLCGLINNKYLQHYLISQKKELTELGWGSAQPNISREKIVSYLFPLPPLSEQRRIVAKLEELLPLVDAYEKEEEALSKLNAAFPERMRKSILQEAVSGKLVPQIESEGSAADLLKGIEAEKKALVAAGKMKKEKPLPAISEEEKPFEIPESWEWVRLGEVSNFGRNISVEPKEIDNNAWILELDDIEKDTGLILNRKIKAERMPTSTKHLFKAGNVLYSKLRPYLNKVVVADSDGYCTSEIHVLNFGKYIVPDYAKLWLQSPDFLAYVNNCSRGMSMPRLGTEAGKNALFPLPPLAEQKRIVAKVEELMKILDSIISIS